MQAAKFQKSMNTTNINKYLDDTMRAWLGISSDSKVELPTMPEHLKRTFLQIEEHEESHRDQWNCWEHSFSENYHNGNLWTPTVDDWIMETRLQLNRSLQLEPLWPKTHEFAVCLTHDVDNVGIQKTWGQLYRKFFYNLGTNKPSLKNKLVKTLSLLAAMSFYCARNFTNNTMFSTSSCPSIKDTIEACLDIENEFNVKASYFFTVYPLLNFSRYDCVYALSDLCLFRGKKITILDLIKTISTEGFDVGLHGSYHSARNNESLKFEKEYLESMLGVNITTTRQHYLHWNIKDTPKIHENVGMLADTSLGFNRNIGFRTGTSMPYFQYNLMNDRPFNLIQVPLTIHDVPLFTAGGLELNIDKAKLVIELIVEKVRKVGGVVTFLFHPERLAKPGGQELYRWCIEECLKKNAWVTSLDEVSLWWRQRSTKLGISHF